ncbi:MAG: HD-GYP domain-containing protein [Bdellovibrionia bacterium]
MRSWGDIPQWSFEAVQSLLQSLKLVDPVTHAHCLRVGALSKQFAKDLGLNEYQQWVAYYSGVLHDIGKMGIDQAVLHKPGKLTPEEYGLVCEHSVLSEKIVQPLACNEFFKDTLPGVRNHHERIDGKGYPDRKIGDEIPLVARLILIVDTCDAMMEDRSYRKGLTADKVYAELVRCSDTQFDAAMVRVFLQAHPLWQKIANLPDLNRVA